MKEKNISLFYRVFRVLLSISIIAAGLSLIYGCLCIYYSGPKPYSRDAVANAFKSICVPVYICLGLIAVSIVLWFVLPCINEKAKVKSGSKNKLELLLNKKDLSLCDEAKLSALKKEETTRKLIKAIDIAVISLSAIAFLIYALNGSNFDSSDINGSVIKATQVLIPCLTVMFLASIVAEIFIEKSYQCDIKLISDLPSAKKAAEDTDEALSKSDKTLLIIKCVFLLVALGLTIYGFATGGFADVLTKAVNICTECIGLG